ncbi:hypothetical protein ZWY2020_045429 [Hordeum vulgare]|nr:hypothetical protein ZWY2020_045429 [Hordeum vulgare]
MPEGEIKEVNADKLGAQQRIASVGDEHECFLSKFKDLVHRWKRKIYEVSEAGSIYVRVYEDMIDLLRAAIVGPSGTPYHDSLFFFDVRFPPEYPRCPPKVYYHSAFHLLQHFETLVVHHFHERERAILESCSAYASGIVVGSSVRDGAK